MPGMPAGLTYAAEHYGRLSRTTLARLIEPARRAAADGFTITPKMAEHLAGYYDLLVASPPQHGFLQPQTALSRPARTCASLIWRTPWRISRRQDYAPFATVPWRPV